MTFWELVDRHFESAKWIAYSTLFVVLWVGYAWATHRPGSKP